MRFQSRYVMFRCRHFRILYQVLKIVGTASSRDPEHHAKGGLGILSPTPSRYLTLSACARVTCLSVCVSFTTLEAMLIYRTKSGNQWTANDTFLKSCKSAPSIQKQLSKLSALYRTSTRVQSSFKGQVGIECMSA